MRHYLIVFVWLCPLLLFGAEARTELCFDADWLFARYGQQADGTTLTEPQGMERYDYDDSEWRQLDVPHDWGIEGPFRPELEGFTAKLPWRGIGWYRKHFHIAAKDQGKCFYIDFDGAMANAEVWINGHKAAERPYGYISFRVDITPYLHYGDDNVVAVRLNTEILGSRWYPGAGIYRHVRLVKTQPLHVAHWGVFVTTPSITDRQATAAVRVKVDNCSNTPAPYRMRIDIYETDEADRIGKRVASAHSVLLQAEAGCSREDSLHLTVTQPKRWSLEQTNRYVARVTLLDDHNHTTDVYDTPFGFRTIEFTHDNGFLLNGKRVQLQGTCNHHDLGALGAAINTAALKRQLTILKSFGCNALRTSHNPPAPDLLTLADKMGFIVMDEAFDCWNYGKKPGDYGSLYPEWHERDIESLICRDRNHPSVILWSTGNEVQEQYEPETGVARHLTEVVHRFDTTRPATFGASYPSKSAVNGTEMQVDVHGMNYAAGVYGGPKFYGEFLNSDQSVLLNHAAAKSAAEMEELRKKLAEIETNRPTSRSSYFGIVDLAGFPKDRYYLYQSRWMPERPMAHILPHWNFPDRVGQKTPVFVYTSGDEAELFLNGRSLGRKRKGEYEYRLRWDDVVYEPGELRTIAYKDGKQWSADTVQTTGKPVAIKLSADKTTLAADGSDLVFIRISLVDNEGREVPTAEPLIHCSTEGCGRVIATDNGDAASLIPFQETSRTAFNGLLLAIVKADKGQRGTLRFTAEADGLASASLSIKVKR